MPGSFFSLSNVKGTKCRSLELQNCCGDIKEGHLHSHRGKERKVLRGKRYCLEV